MSKNSNNKVNKTKFTNKNIKSKKTKTVINNNNNTNTNTNNSTNIKGKQSFNNIESNIKERYETPDKNIINDKNDNIDDVINDNMKLNINNIPILDKKQSILESSILEDFSNLDLNRTNIEKTKKLLILFDLNGIICTKIDYTNNIPKDVEIIKYGYLNKSMAVVRPGIKEYINNLSINHVVGIYSSTTYKNIQTIISTIWKDKNPFIFVADRNVTSLDPDFGIDKNIDMYDTVKKLKNIWNHPLYNAKREWNINNTFIIDDEYRKLRYNLDNNILVVNKYNPIEKMTTDDIYVKISNKIEQFQINK